MLALSNHLHKSASPRITSIVDVQHFPINFKLLDFFCQLRTDAVLLISIFPPEENTANKQSSDHADTEASYAG